MASLTGELLHARDAFLLSFVREHRACTQNTRTVSLISHTYDNQNNQNNQNNQKKLTFHDVADGEHSGHGGGVGVHVDDDLTACVGLDARGVQTQFIGERFTSGGDEDDVSLDLGGFAL